MYLTKTSGNLNPRGQQPQSNLQVSTVRSFEGGLNVTDTDLNMSPKFAKTLDNFERGTDGSQSLRPGTVLISHLTVDASDIVNHTYFAGLVWSVQVGGTITTSNAAGTVVFKGLNNTGASAWGPGIQYVDFTIFNGDLIIVNDRDKPLIVSGRPTDPNYLIVQFLVDLASLSNVNTPIGKYVVAHGRYTVIAGVATNPSSLFISMQDTSGTWFGDPIPNDAIVLDVGPRVSLGDSTITGIIGYRDKLLVCFERGVLPINLGVYTGTPAVHTPTDDGFMEEYGCLAHRSLVALGDDTFFCDNVGINSVQRISLFNTLRPVRLSQLIDPLTTALLQPLTPAQVQQYVFAVYDLRHFRYMLFMPVFSGGVIQETVCFSYTNIPTMKIQAWARLRGWIWQSACRTALQNVIFSRGNKLYAYDFDNAQGIGADRLNDPDINSGQGENINFEWEFPWADFKHRMDIKYIKYIAFDTEGMAPFTVEAYVDNLIEQQSVRMPMLSIELTAAEGPGYGAGPYGDSPFGGGRRTADERTLGFNTKFKLLKMRIIGSTKAKLRIVSVSLAYLHGGIRR